MTKINNFIEELLWDNYEDDGPGFGVLFIKSGKKLFNGTFGLADVKNKIKISPQSNFRLASLSKSFTGLAINILFEKKLLSPDTEISKFFPNSSFEGIRVANLLYHTSGLADYMDSFDEYWEQNNDIQHKGENKRKLYASNKDMLKLFADVKPERQFAPGTKFEYSNTGYALLALLIEAVSELDYAEFLKKHIFLKAGMNNTTVLSEPNSVQILNRVRGYKWDKKQNHFTLYDDHYLNGFYGDGGIFSSLNDLFKYENALRQNKIISSQYLKQSFQSGTLNNGKSVGYGFGWECEQIDDNFVVHHTGTWLGFAHYMIYAVDENAAVFILSNNIENEEIVTEIGDEIYNELV